MTRRRKLWIGAAVTAGVVVFTAVAIWLVPLWRAREVGPEQVEQGGGKRKIEYWVAPMDPSYRSDQPGKSPMGMDLVPVYEGEPEPGPGLTISPVVVQNMGVRTALVRRGPIHRNVRAVGSIVVAEDEVSVVNLRYSGWVEKIYVDETGVRVREGQPLFEIYSPELVSAQEEYLIALRTGGRRSSLAESARERLRFWDLSPAQIASIARSGEVTRTLTVTAPQSGYVLRKEVVLGARVMEGADLYRIGDLRSIWVTADVYEADAPFVEEGDAAAMYLEFEPGRTYSGEVSYVYPTLDPETRTLEVRLELANPGLVLKPGMFAIVEIQAQRKQRAVVVPTEAIIHSGQRTIVFVALGVGHYEMREIVTGVVGDNNVTQVRAGLEVGEVVVTSGQFLLDSESQLQEAARKMEPKGLQVPPQDETGQGAGTGEGGAAGEGGHGGHDGGEGSP